MSLLIDNLPPLTEGSDHRISLRLKGHDDVGYVGIDAYEDKAHSLHNFLSEQIPAAVHFGAVLYNKKTNSLGFRLQSDVKRITDEATIAELTNDNLDDSELLHGFKVMRYSKSVSTLRTQSETISKFLFQILSNKFSFPVYTIVKV